VYRSNFAKRMLSTVNWNFLVYFEVFSPAEKFDSASLMNLIFPQIVLDVLNEDCVRIGKADRQKIHALLGRCYIFIVNNFNF
jgi:hypothetical protein